MCFSKGINDLGYCDLYKQKIEIDNNFPIVKRPFKMSKLHQEILQEIVNDFIKAGLVTPSKSNWSSPAFLVYKPHLSPNFDKTKKQNYRLVIDYRALNNITKSDVFPIPIIQHALDRLTGKKFFSKFDVMTAFHQVAIEETSKEITAFVTPFGLYEYNVLPMGLKNSPATFQRLMNKLIQPIRNLGADSYFDDIILATDTFEKQIKI